MKKPAEAGLLFLVTRHSCLGDYAARAKTSSLAAFAVTSLLGLRPSPGVLPSLLSHPVEARSGPSETYFVLQYGPFHKESHGLQICFWWRCRHTIAGSRTPFIQLHTTILMSPMPSIAANKILLRTPNELFLVH